MLENTALPFMQIFFLQDKFFRGKILPLNPPLPTQKNPLENVYTLLNNHYYT